MPGSRVSCATRFSIAGLSTPATLTVHAGRGRSVEADLAERLEPLLDEPDERTRRGGDGRVRAGAISANASQIGSTNGRDVERT